MNELINLGNGAMVKMTMLKGEAGSSISSIAKTSTEGLVDTYTITLTDGSTKTFKVTNGKSISSIAKTDTTGLVDTYTITFNDNTTSTFTVTNGKGISSIAKTDTTGLVDTYTITFNDGTTSTFDVTNGANGVGISSIAKTDTTGLVDTYTITYTNGQTTTFTVTNGANGSDVAQSALAPVETGNTASQSYAVGKHLIWNGVYYKVTQTIASGEAFNVGVNIEPDTVSAEIESLDFLKERIENTPVLIGTFNGKKLYKVITREIVTVSVTANNSTSITLNNIWIPNTSLYKCVSTSLKIAETYQSWETTGEYEYPKYGYLDAPYAIYTTGNAIYMAVSFGIAFESISDYQRTKPKVTFRTGGSALNNRAFVVLGECIYMER